jgi:penicillin amidase
MRIVPFLISTVIAGALIFALNKRWGSIPALGRFLSPQTGFWQTADAEGEDLNEELQFANLKGKVDVYLDERLVPHVFADNDEDAYFVQGYLHAKYRLWQMDFQTRYAAGRLSEVLGNEQLLNVDRLQRRMGMVFAAERMLQEAEKEPTTKAVLDAYTAGVNSYIGNITEATLPFEFKLLGYRPEAWSNLKIALFAKLMAADLAGLGLARDLPFTNLKSVLSLQDMALLFPQVADSTQPIVPKGTPFTASTAVPAPPADVDSLYYGNDSTVNPVLVPKPVDINGSNNWAISGSKTASGAPILSNDPHLRLSLPSIWYEMQLHTPTMNVYGATFPCAPGVLIGFNDSIAFGVTNAQRDVIDYFRIRFKDDSRREYWYNGKWQACQIKVEKIKKTDGSIFTDTVAYTVFGPVVYDKTFNNGDSSITTALALRWAAHEPSNELLGIHRLNRATSYDQYAEAIKLFSVPGQNFLFAGKSGDIAVWQQGRFPLRWPGQGLYVLPGEDSAYNWKGWIPQQDNPHAVNPPQGFLQSANQRPVDSTYPYFIPGDYVEARGISAYRQLDTMQRITPQHMMRLQNDVYSPLAAMVTPFLFRHLEVAHLDEREQKIANKLRNWNFRVTSDSKAATIYQTWYDSLEKTIWLDELAQTAKTVTYPSEQTLFENLARDSAFRFIDNINTPQVETLKQQVTAAFKMAAAQLAKDEAAGNLEWWKHKESAIQHLLRDAVPALGRYKIKAGGWGNVLNAFTKYNGPSWRMIVHLTPETEAYGIYPAGQSGNPGSRFYDSFIDDWVAGKYYRLWMMKESERGDKRIIGNLHFSKA